MLEATNLTKSYNGTKALDALNLKIEPGEVFCLLGFQITMTEGKPRHERSAGSYA